MPGFEIIDHKEKKEVLNVFKEKKPLRMGKRVALFEKKFSNYIGCKYSVAVSSGTAAIKIALLAAGIKPGDEVITQSFTFVAVVEAIADIGARPKIVNINDPEEKDRYIN